MEEYIENLAPPTGAFNGNPQATMPSSFWLLMYGTWHFRLDSRRFDSFCARHGWGADRGKAGQCWASLALEFLQGGLERDRVRRQNFALRGRW
jgi:hypothetical protein